MSSFIPYPELMERTLVLAQKGWGGTHPNPMVGCLIEEDGQVVAEGFHKQAGEPHAEIVALQNLARKPKRGAVLYVSLEPCSTTGRTPPCTSAILEAGIEKVVVCTIDPDPRHAGRGLTLLREHGVDVELAPVEIGKRAERLNFIFNQYRVTGHPLIALKMAFSANRMVAARAGYPSRVTGESARADVMRWRRHFPSICVGSGTVLADNPSLTARLPDGVWCPVRIVIDSTLATLSSAFAPRNIYTDDHASRTLVLTTAVGMANHDAVNQARDYNVRIIEGANGVDGRVTPSALRQVLRELKLCGTYCEGGPALARSLLAAKEVDYIFHYQSPQTFTSPEALYGPDFTNLDIKDLLEAKLGEDTLKHGFL
jgi:diaminohydroxyphosphoribosylaminopyrimidine deaminase/5-amino-6-(5-phosphoribosylamino)uracil reductase